MKALLEELACFVFVATFTEAFEGSLACVLGLALLEKGLQLSNCCFGDAYLPAQVATQQGKKEQPHGGRPELPTSTKCICVHM